MKFIQLEMESGFSHIMIKTLVNLENVNYIHQIAEEKCSINFSNADNSIFVRATIQELVIKINDAVI